MRFLVAVDQQSGSPIELARDIEQMLGELVLRRAREQRAADSQVDVGTAPFRDERIRGLLDPVVQESVGAPLPQNEACVDGLPQRRVHSLLRLLANQGQCGQIDDVAKAGELFHRRRGWGRRAASAFRPGGPRRCRCSFWRGCDRCSIARPARQGRTRGARLRSEP